MADAGERLGRKAQLSATKRALLEQRLRGKGLQRTVGPTITRLAPGAAPPLSFAQERLWYLNQLEPNAAIYSVRSAYRLTGTLDVDSLRQSLTRVVARHDALRTTFRIAGEVPVIEVAPVAAFPLPLVDLERLSATEREQRLDQVLAEEATWSFDLERGPLFRARLVRLVADEHVLILVAHHTIIDGWSLTVLRQELIQCYEASVQGAPLSMVEPGIRYGDYAAWQRATLQGAKLERLLGYWRERLAGDLPVLEMPTDRPRPPVQSYRGTSQAFELPSDLVNRLTHIAREEGVTLFMVLLTGAALMLSKYTRQREIVFGSPVANRELPELEGLIGLFVNVLVLRTAIPEGSDFRALLREVRDVCLGAYGHQEMPFERLVQELRPERDLSRTPLFQVLFAFQDTTGEPNVMGDVRWTPVQWHPPIARTDLAFWLEATNGQVTGALEYSTDLFEHATIARFLKHFDHLLRGIATNPDRPLAELHVLSDAERSQVLVEWNETAHTYPESSVHSLIAGRAKDSPNDTAVVFGNHSLTFAELEARSNRIARYLRDRGARPGERVGILLERSDAMLAAVLGVLKTGAAYVPLDPDYPAERIAFMQRDAELAALVTSSTLVDRAPLEVDHVICLDREHEEIAQCAATPLADTTTPDELAYVIYTSGSTGTPKGVEVRHRGVVNFLTSMAREPGMQSSDVVLAVTTLSFDIAVLELLLPLTAGATTVIADQETAGDGTRLLQLLKNSHATVMQATPATWRLLLAAGWSGGEGLKVLCGGEALSQELAEVLVTRASAVWNMYGPTETTIWSTCYHVKDPSAPVLIGRPIANTTLYVLDDDMHPVPVGVPGELYIGGAGLARGYWRREALTAERFVADPFSDDPTERLYRTGDWVRYRADGNVEYLRRVDNQVKLRGFRIELGEVEAALAAHEAVSEAVAVVRSYSSDDRRLVAYVVPKADAHEPTGTDLRTFLRERLPGYMIPAMFVTLESLPLTPNGKVDRKALPEPGLAGKSRIVPPTTPMEKTIAEIWSSALGSDGIDVNDNFFDLGGHSLLSMQVIARIDDAIGVRLSARDMVLQTLGQIAALCEERASAPEGPKGRPGLGAKLLRFVTRRGS